MAFGSLMFTLCMAAYGRIFLLLLLAALLCYVCDDLYYRVGWLFSFVDTLGYVSVDVAYHRIVFLC